VNAAGDGPAQVVPLHGDGPELLQPAPRGQILDAFGDDVEVQAAAEVGDGTHDHLVVRVVHEVPHEAAVDLDLLHGHALEVGQRRVSGAEVADRQPDADLHPP
jgi:hypothetical protein